MPSGNVPITPTSPGAMDTICKNESDCCSNRSDTNVSTRLTKQMSYNPTEYVQRARVTKAAPPKPAANPLQFVQIKPCNLYQSAQEQLKRAEQVKKVKEVVKEEPEDWQSNLDNWKTGRRKLVAPIIERVIETKKYESDDLVKNRKKSKTFSEMMEERGSKGRKCSLRVYNDGDDDDDDLNGFGFSANDTISGKSSVSEDYENQSVNSDNPMDGDKNRFIDNNSNPDESFRRDSISSPGFDDNTSNSTLSAASLDPAYSSSFNSSRNQTSTLSSNFNRVESWAEKHHSPANNVKPKPRLTPKIEGHLANYETKIEQDERNVNVTVDKIDLPKIDISSRRELFEKEQAAQLNRSHETIVKKPIVLVENESTASIKERLSNLGKRNEENKETTPNKSNRMSGDFSGARDRFVNNENEQFFVIEPKAPKIDVPVVPLKERLMNLESSMEITISTSTSTTITGSSIDAPITKLENRARKMSEPKLIGLNVHGSDDNDQHDEDSGINSDDLQSSLASQQSQPSPELMMNNQQQQSILKHNEPVPAARKPEVLPRRQITPDLVKITSNLTIDDDLLQANDSIDDDADNSVIDALDIALNAIDIEKPNEMIDIAMSFDEIYEEINDFTPLKGNQSSNLEKANGNDLNGTESVDEPYYQVPKKQSESYYEVPTSRPIPVYENVDMYYDLTSSQNKFVVDGGASKLKPAPIEIGSKCVMQPPKEKPPPPPIEPIEPNEINEADEEPLPQDAMKRINSTKRIKKEIRNKRSSFLGIEGTNDDENYLEFSIAPPPNMAEFIKEERRIEKQIYIKTGLYDSSDTFESRDSGVSENHSRQSSEPVTSTSSDEPEQETNTFFPNSTRPEIISALEKDKQLLEAGKNALAMECRVLGTQQWVFNDGFSTSSQTDEIDPILKTLDDKERQRCIEEQIREEEEVLRVERELLQLEQEELKRQRENMINRKMYEQRIQQQQQQQQQLQQQQSTPPKQQQPIDHRHSLQDINANGGGNLYANVYTNDINTSNGYHMSTDHRKSMPNLQEMTLHEIPMDKCQMPIPPAKPLRVQEYSKYNKQIYSNGASIDPRTNQSMPMHLNTMHSNSNDELQTYSVNTGSSNGSLNSGSQQQYSNMTRHTLHALSAAPKPKFQDAWVQQQNKNNNYENTNDWNGEYIDPAAEQYIRPRLKDPIGDSWLSLQQKRRSDPNFNYNKHWLIQEAEQRRIDQARSNRTNGTTNGKTIIPRKGSTDNKPLPDAVIQTLTQRVQNKLNDKKRFENQHNHYHYHHHPHQSIGSSTEQLVLPHQHNGNVSYHQSPLQLGSPKSEAPREILSVSGKKKCSYCCEELGRGAAMIIESLRLFYHLDCFKCCVCRVQLGDGISGADVRVRNQKLHCNNCFSSDDGIKFSCV